MYPRSTLAHLSHSCTLGQLSLTFHTRVHSVNSRSPLSLVYPRSTLAHLSHSCTLGQLSLTALTRVPSVNSRSPLSPVHPRSTLARLSHSCTLGQLSLTSLTRAPSVNSRSPLSLVHPRSTLARLSHSCILGQLSLTSLTGVPSVSSRSPLSLVFPRSTLAHYRFQVDRTGMRQESVADTRAPHRTLSQWMEHVVSRQHVLFCFPGLLSFVFPQSSLHEEKPRVINLSVYRYADLRFDFPGPWRLNLRSTSSNYTD